MKRNQFTLKKLKTLKAGGLDLKWHVVEQSNNEINNFKHAGESTVEPHPDLRNVLKLLQPMLCDVFFVPKAHRNEVIVTGISVIGEEDRKGAVIMGTLEATNGLNKMSINTYLIRFETTNYGWDEEFEGYVNTLEDEVFMYLFEGKKAQSELL